MLSYTSQDETILLFPKSSDAALVNVTPTTFFDKLMKSNPNAYRSLTRPVVTCIYILMGVSRRLTDSAQSHVQFQAQDMVKRWETSGEWKTLGFIMKKGPRPATTLPFNIDSRNPIFQFDDWTFTLPQIDKKFFDKGVLDISSFSKTFAKQNEHQVVAENVIFTAVAHLTVNHFPTTAAQLFMEFCDQVHSSYRGTALENRVNRSGISEKDLSNSVISGPILTNSMEFRDSKSDDQSEVNAMSKGSGSIASSKEAHVS